VAPICGNAVKRSTTIGVKTGAGQKCAEQKSRLHRPRKELWPLHLKCPTAVPMQLQAYNGPPDLAS
jgi:hypothetical protein